MVMAVKNNETVIYVRLNEGTETFAPCRAKILENEQYEILENENLDLDNDATSIWEFFPGDIVTCVPKENYIIAKNLIRSTFPDRKLYELIFLLVNNFGIIEQNVLNGFKSEIKRLCTDVNIIQKKHPQISKWLESNCANFNDKNHEKINV